MPAMDAHLCTNDYVVLTADVGDAEGFLGSVADRCVVKRAQDRGACDPVPALGLTP